MGPIKCLLFDCMETVVDIEPLPTLSDYAHWAYDGSGVEGFWDSFDEFFSLFKQSRKEYNEKLPEYKEYELSERFQHIALMTIGEDNSALVRHIKDSLYCSYWQTYKAKSYVKEEVKSVLSYLTKKYCLGIVSNFMVRGGVEELLQINDVLQYFDFVVTSINEGWRKPHPYLYKAALKRDNMKAEETLFVGDDFLNDYEGPRKMGMKAILYDTKKRKSDIVDRVTSFVHLKEML